MKFKELPWVDQVALVAAGIWGVSGVIGTGVGILALALVVLVRVLEVLHDVMEHCA